MELPARELLSWQKYWREEPWGAYRDNLHTAILCRQVLRTVLAKGAKMPKIDDFMLRLPDEIQEEQGAMNAKTFLHTLRSIARKGKKKVVKP